jgi:hypothetical protein
MSQDLRYARDVGVVGLIDENRGKLGLLVGFLGGAYAAAKGPQLLREWRKQDAKNLVDELRNQGYSLTPITGTQTSEPYAALTNAITAAVKQGFKDGVAELKGAEKI